ncbi:hypothetical protein AB0M92_26945 [Streptomyces sp. NPDC051582]|uniref:hypothetical protein n=1 Tax=Streptomyces sp. NPDC051582 TaxID=3155167 RepID=UPI003440D995
MDPGQFAGQRLRLRRVSGRGQAGRQGAVRRLRHGSLLGGRRQQGPEFLRTAGQPVPHRDGRGPQPGRVLPLPRGELRAARPREVPEQ